MLNELRLRLWRNLGGCPYCIRKAFQAAVLAWGVAFALFAIGVGAPPLVGASAVASGLSALWIAHILAFAAKKVSRAAKVVRTDDYSSRSMSRRDLVPAFGKAILTITVVSTAPAFAQSDGCNCMTCAGPHDCCSNTTGMGCSCGFQYNVACYLCC
jgi:hypothetical protein